MGTGHLTVLEALRRVPLFSELSESELASLAADAVASEYAAGQILFNEGDRGGDLLVVATGSIRILKTSASGRQQLIAIERPGSSLGEVSVFDGGRYSTMAIADTPATLLRVSGERFRALCLSQPRVALKVIEVLGSRLRRTRELVEELSFATVRSRLIAHLLRLADPQGEVLLSENNEELAARLGTVRELVSRNLGRLHNEGLIVVRRRALRIPDVARLRAELES